MYYIASTFPGMPIETPYVRMVMADYIYSGFCAVIDYKAVTDYLVRKGDIEPGTGDYTFYHILYLKVRIHPNILGNSTQFKSFPLGRRYASRWHFLL